MQALMKFPIPNIQSITHRKRQFSVENLEDSFMELLTKVHWPNLKNIVLLSTNIGNGGIRWLSKAWMPMLSKI